MKKILVLVLMAMVVNAVAFAQTYQEVVYLKSGSVIRGVIVEQIPGVSLRIQTADGSVFAYQMDEVEKITKEQVVTSQRTREHPQKTKEYKLRTGYRGFVEVGGYGGVRTSALSGAELSTTHGYQILPSLFAGIGFGLDLNRFSYRVGQRLWIPIFSDFRGTLPCRSTGQPFIDFKIGYSVVGAYEGFYMNPSIGCRFSVGRDHGISVGVGYALQKRYPGDKNGGAISFRFGVDF